MTPDEGQELRQAFAKEVATHLLGMARAVVSEDMSALRESASSLRIAGDSQGLGITVALCDAMMKASSLDEPDLDFVRRTMDVLQDIMPKIIEAQATFGAILEASPAYFKEIAAADSLPGAAIPSTLRSRPERAPTALVADDSPTVRQMHADLMAAAGYEVRTARDGSSALRQLENGIVDVIVSDFDMAPMNGRDLVAALSQDERYASIPVVLVSSRSRDDVLEHLGDLTVAQIVSKAGAPEETVIEAARAAHAGSSAAGSGKARVLVADDTDILRFMVRDQLLAAGYDVVEARDGEEAVALARTAAPDVALIDREMPKLDGFGVLEALQSFPETAALPVVFVTGRVTADELAEGLDRGAHDYVRKPVQPAELLARVRTALRLRALRDELALRNEELEAMAQTDVLTGLTNRRQLTSLLEAATGTASRYQRELAVIMLDIDHFKSVNDTYGHAGGDEALRAVSEVLRRNLRSQDTPARWGGEEFLVLLPEIGAGGAELAAERLRSALAAEPVVCDGQTINITASFGVAEWSAGEGAEALIARADDALYEAKSSGRDRVCVAIAA
ncbi:MAG TPA: diguanylate cyclase [Baekduia sp.]|nr:diguanylate cyclase [Baekduia sp.]